MPEKLGGMNKASKIVRTAQKLENLEMHFLKIASKANRAENQRNDRQAKRLPKIGQIISIDSVGSTKITKVILNNDLPKDHINYIMIEVSNCNEYRYNYRLLSK